MKLSMKIKVFSLCLAVFGVLSALELPVLASTCSGNCGENIKWTLNTSTGLLTITGKGSMEDYASSSDTPWFLYAHEIERITVSEGITRIGNYAFGDSSALTAVSLANSVQALGAYAFANCNNLTDVRLGSGLTYIEDYAFYNCISLEQISLSSYVLSVGKAAFAHCVRLKAVTGSLSIKEIPDFMFEACYELTEIYFPIGLKAIGEGAIKDCDKLERLVFCGSKNDWEKITKGADWDAQAGQGTVRGTYEFLFHSYDEGVVTLPPTTTESGKITYTCVICNTRLTNTLEPIQSIRYGDVNGDEAVDLNDAVLLKVYLANYDYEAGTSTIEIGMGADANGDGKIDLNDAVILAVYLANFDYETGTSSVLLGPNKE